MNKSVTHGIGIAFLAAMLTGCASKSGVEQVEESGFLTDYALLTSTKNPQGRAVSVWVSPKFTPSNYNAILLEPLVLHPQPQPNEHVSAEELQRILAYANDTLKQSISQRFHLVDRAGPGVVRLRQAISGVAAKGEGLKAYQYVPIAFVVTQANRAATGKPQRAFIVAEADATDSVTGELLGQGMTVGTGERLARIEGKQTLTLETLKPLLDELASQAFPEQLANHVKPK